MKLVEDQFVFLSCHTDIMCFAKTSSLLRAQRGAGWLPVVATRILSRLHEFDQLNGRDPLHTYCGGCYLIARAVRTLLGSRYKLKVVALKKKTGSLTVLTPHVICIGPCGAIVDAKLRYVHETNWQASLQFLPEFRMSGYAPRQCSDYVLNVDETSFTSDSTSFGDSYLETYKGLKEKVETGLISTEWREALNYITA